MSDQYIANRFRVLEVLGQGGMGTVYRVVDSLDEDRELALKTFRSDRPITAERRLRFRQEFRVMAGLHHPNTVDVYDCGFLDGATEYLTMEYVPGRELSALIADGPLDFATIYDLSLQLLLALEFIHSRLYVHRDIKPDNLRVRPDGVLKVMDFGLMERVGGRRSTNVTGTASYMAPEVVVGGPLDTASDLYSVGCVICELTCGRPPFVGTLHQVLAAHVHDQPAPMRSHRADVPPGLEAIVRKLLTKAIPARYANAAEVVDDLARLAGVHRVRQDLGRNESYLVSDAMVGRKREIWQLEVALADVEGGHGRSLFVVGPAGVGKSRLVSELLVRAKLRGMQVLEAPCKAGQSPYAPLLAALRPLLSASDEGELEDHRQLLLAVEQAAEQLRRERKLDGSELRERIGAWLLAATQANPIVLALDDLQWCDRASLELLNHFIRNSGDARLLFVATVRGEETPRDSPLWLTVVDGQTARIDLGPLDPEQVRVLIHSMLPKFDLRAEFLDALYAATAGNAFFVTEVLRDLMERQILIASEDHWTLPSDWELHVPERVEAVVQDRLTRIDPEVLALARLAAVLGPSLTREALLALSGLDDQQLFERIEELIERQFLASEDGRLVFPHDRVREALYEGLDPDRRAALHQRVGEHLEQRYADAIEHHLGELTLHFRHGSDEAKTLDYTLRAAAQADANSQEAAAIDYRLAAIELLDGPGHDGPEEVALRFDLQARVAEAALALWPATTVEMAARCREALETRGDPDKIARVMKFVVRMVGRSPGFIRSKAEAEFAKPPPPYVHATPEGLAARLPPPAPSWLPKLLEAHALGCVASGHTGKPEQGAALGRRALELLPFPNTPLEGAMSTALAGCLQTAGHFDAMGELLVRSRALLFDVDLGEQSVALSARVGAAVFSNYGVFQGRRHDDELVNYGLWAADELHKPDFYNQVWIYPCLFFAWTGRDREATQLLEQIEDNCRRLGIPPDPWAQYLRPYLAWQRGAFDEALALVSRALSYSSIERIMLAHEHACVLAGHVLIDGGDLDGAEQRLREVEDRVRGARMDLLLTQALLGRARLALARGPEALDEARACLDEAEALARAGLARNPLHHVIGLRERARLELLADRPSHAERSIAAARALLEGDELDCPIELGRLEREAAELALARDQDELAAEAFTRAQACFADLDNTYLVQTTIERWREALPSELSELSELVPSTVVRGPSGSSSGAHSVPFDETLDISNSQLPTMSSSEDP